MLTLLTNGKNFSFSAFPLELITMKKCLISKCLICLPKQIQFSVIMFRISWGMKGYLPSRFLCRQIWQEGNFKLAWRTLTSNRKWLILISTHRAEFWMGSMNSIQILNCGLVEVCIVSIFWLFNVNLDTLNS